MCCFSVLRLFCGGVCTSSSFGDAKPCLWGCDHVDKLSEILSCKSVQFDISNAIGTPIIPRNAVECFYFIGAAVPGVTVEDWCLARCIFIHILCLYYNAKRYNASCSRQLPNALAKQLAGQCNVSRMLIQNIRQFRPRSSAFW